MAAGIFSVEDVERRHADVEELFLVEIEGPHLSGLRHGRSIRGAAFGTGRPGD